jgi:hypothetical protein
MGFLKFLEGIGDRLGILEAVPDAAVPTECLRTRTISLRDLAGEIKAKEVHALAEHPSELAVPFDRIFETAGICPDPGAWTADRLKQFVSSESIKQKTKPEAQKLVLDTINSQGGTSESVIKDAIARDQALDSFELCINNKMKVRIDAYKIRMQQIEEQIRNLQAEQRRLLDGTKEDEAQWKEWVRRKRAYEKELASVVAYIVDHPVISTDED